MTDKQYLQPNRFGNYKDLGLVAKILLTCGLLLMPLIGLQAQQNPLNLNTLSAVKLINNVTRACGSGLVHNNTIITNYHVMQSVCPSNECGDLRLQDFQGAFLNVNSSLIIRYLQAAAFDLAILKIDDPNFEAPQALSNLPRSASGSDKILYSYSFPSCGPMAVSSGLNVSTIGKLYNKTTLGVQHGSSGGGIFDNQGNLNAIVGEAESFANGMSSVLLGTPFSFSRSIPAERLKELLYKDRKEIFDLQMAALENFYLSEVVEAKGVKRVEEGSRYLTKVKTLALDNIGDSKGAATLLLALDNYPYPLFVRKGWELETLSGPLLTLVFATTLEQSGLSSAFARKLSSSQIRELQESIVAMFPAEKEKLLELVLKTQSTNFPGATFYLLNLFLPCIAIVLLGAITWMGGLVWAVGKANSLRMAIFGALKWSLLVWIMCLSLILVFYPS